MVVQQEHALILRGLDGSAAIFIWFFTDKRSIGIVQWADSVRYVSSSLMDIGNIRNMSFAVPSL